MKSHSFYSIMFMCLSVSLIGQSSYSEIKPGTSGVKGNNIPIISQVSPAAVASFYNDSTTWANACSGGVISTESWQNTLVPPNSVSVCGNTVSSTSNDACFGLGDVLDGFSLSAFGGSGGSTAVLTPAFLSVPGNAVGPNFFDANARIDFSIPVNSVSFRLITPLEPAVNFKVEAFGAAGSLGSALMTSNGNVPVFMGILSNKNIQYITVVSQGPSFGAELFTNISFRKCSTGIPTLGEWALISLGLLLLILGVAVVRQRIRAIA